jgi:hypothetical protein
VSGGTSRARNGRWLISTAIDEHTPTCASTCCSRVAPLFRLDGSAAKAVLRDVLAATDRWADVARTLDLPATAIKDMAPAFTHEQREVARAAL